MKLRHYEVVAALGLMVLGSAAFGAGLEKLSSATTPVVTTSAPSQEPPQAAPDKPADAPLTRAEILKQGPTALEQNCNKCHGSDKWEGTNRDKAGWNAIVTEMSRQMDVAQMPPLSEKTFNVIVGYLALTHPQ